ncbi:MAG: type I methionyl aminopeptidase [Flavobacteriales bacterium]|jgi:methionyl aminopeptidase|uniref:type I methionyl aminopeptidase n=1 Tax=Blattabacterium sp. (Mastotermes darwiniensis) TaxID=39768 RepID=UPI000231DE78|nr:type I methionyl aminopeptidase [Blattabacterium sp. (Mastotermes darwiniensis)]AER40684.1 methionine aminopeptidase [Blattabacterium sp. (Mastotermes darwiniensis) str. MADAR]MDR1804788.1 type I methionyl aminopeptidase [Flavobacteriales bacterium]
MVKTIEEIILIKKSACLASRTLGMLAGEVKPGINTLYLDHLAENFIRDHGGVPAFLGLYDFPNTLCVSPNYQVVHGIPNQNPLCEGDILSIDCGVYMNGFYGEHAYTFEVGIVSNTVKRFLNCSKKSLYAGLSKCKKGNFIGDIGYSIQSCIENYGYSVVKDLVGHGLGKKMHEDPQIPNFGEKGKGIKLEEGFVLSIEPMVNKGKSEVDFHKDGWTITTSDRDLSAHFEHNVAIVNGFPCLLSTFRYIYDKLNIHSLEEKPFQNEKINIDFF